MISKKYLRSVTKNKTVFFIKILGLSVALSSVFFILMYCFGELSYDNFHQNKDNIFRVVCKINENGKEISASATIPAPVGTIIQNQIPEITNFSRISYPYKDNAYKYKENFIHEYTDWVDTAFMHIFSIPIISGDRGKLKPEALLISEKLARKYFGSEDPVGKIINNYGSGENGTPHTITGVFRMPENTHFNFEIIGFDDLSLRHENWDHYMFTYILLRPDANIKVVENKISATVKLHQPKEKQNVQYVFSLQKLEDIHLYSNLKFEAKINGNINLIRGLFFLAITIIIIALINYINLSVAQSLEKAKETGIKIVHGASKFKICIDTLVESVTTNIIALLLAIIIVLLALPLLNSLVGKDLLHGLSLRFWGIYISIFCLGTLASGLYLSLIMVSLNKKDILKGKFKYSRKGIISRKVFLGLQFSASIAVIIFTFFVYKQINYMQSYNKGFNPDQVICISDCNYLKENTNEKSFKADLLKFPQILKVTNAKSLPGNEVYLKEVIKRSGLNNSFNKIFEVIRADEDYIDVFQFKIIAGRKFSIDHPSDKQCVILNEEAVKYLHYNSPKDAIGEEIVYRGDKYKVIGIMKNFNQLSLKYSIQPFAYFLGSQGYYAIRVNASNMKECLSIVDKTYRKYFDGAFKFHFVDDFYNQVYQNEIKFSKLFTFFSILLTMVTSVGLFGLALYLAQQRSKEMAIHVINGAAQWKIFFLMAKDFMIILTVSFCIVCPVVYEALNKWLQSYAYKTPLSWWVFAAAGAVALAVILITVSWQSWRAATRNPVEALRYE